MFCGLGSLERTSKHLGKGVHNMEEIKSNSTAISYQVLRPVCIKMDA
jgi:hypothetical protein